LRRGKGCPKEKQAELGDQKLLGSSVWPGKQQAEKSGRQAAS